MSATSTSFWPSNAAATTHNNVSVSAVGGFNSSLTTSSTAIGSSLPAVSRSAEWWSCVRTAVKIAQSTTTASSNSSDVTDQQRQLQPWWVGWNPPVQLPAAPSLEQSDLWQLQEDGLSLLRGMRAELQKLQSLVRRRGHTNDPTQDIAHSVRQLELDAQDLAELIRQQQLHQQLHGRFSAQYQRHVTLVAQWLQQAAAQQAAQLKQVLQVRANVLAEQAQQRRKLLKSANGSQDSNNHSNGIARKTIPSPLSSNSNNSNNNVAFQSPLFTATPQSLKNSQKRRNNRLTPSNSSFSSTNSLKNNSNTSSGNSNLHTASHLYGNGSSEDLSIPVGQPQSSMNRSAPSSSNGNMVGLNTGTSGYSYYASGGGYGGGSSSSGIRQRKASAAVNRGDDANSSVQDGSGDWLVQEQIQERQKQRQTRHRVEAARQAERTLSELSTLFGKMSMLITQQGETLEKVEDDVETALIDVAAGQAELQILHHIKKGNRGLIIKVFALLIFFIIFMKLYAKRK